jgi:hypothetical protein
MSNQSCRYAIGFVWSALVAGCGGIEAPAPGASLHVDPPQKTADPTYTGTVIRTADGALMLGESVAIDVTKMGSSERMEAQVLAFGRDELLTAVVRLPMGSSLSSSGQARIAKVPLTGGVAYVERQRKNGPTSQGGGGTISYQLRGRYISMDIQGDATDLSASLTATAQVRCWVPPGDIGVQGNGAGTDGAQELVLDERLESKFCDRFR